MSKQEYRNSSVAKSFNQVARLQITTFGFQRTEIYPYNSNIFIDLDFLSTEQNP